MKVLNSEKIDDDSPANAQTETTGFFTVKKSILLLLFIITLLTGLSWHTWNLYRKFRATDVQYHRMTELSGVIIHLDEVLTMSARMAAATGDLKWEKRYRNFEPKLDAAIKEADTLASESLMNQAVYQTDTANVKLVTMGNKAFEFIRQNNLQAATTVLYSREYENQKRLYTDGMKRYVAALQRHAKARFEQARHVVLWMISLITLIFCLTVVALSEVFRICKKIAKQQQTEEQLRQAKEQTENSNQRLKQLNLQLTETYKKLMEASHFAGMAEVATDVLHNVGNVLNSINVSATIITEKIVNSEIANLKKIADMIQDHIQDLPDFITQDAQGKHIPVYLTQVADHLVCEQTQIIEKLHSLTSNIDYVKEIVKTQQGYAKMSGVEVSTTLDDVINDAIQINRAGLKRHGITLIQEYADIGNVNIDRQKILQIIVNLINNAKYALIAKRKKEKLLTIRFFKNENNRIQIEVIDNGVGITSENLKKIFRHGFTTKKHGHGFGLHSGALAAKEIEASLTAHSDGPGQGATFTLEIPYKSVGVKKCTI